MLQSEDALRSVVDISDQVRSRGLLLLKLLESARDVGPSGDKPAAPPSPPEAHKLYVLDLLRQHEREVRGLLRGLHDRVDAIENCKPGSSGSSSTGLDMDGYNSKAAEDDPSEVYETSEAIHSIAVKGVSRDIAHSLQNEISWRGAASKAANEADTFFHQRLATLFPDLEVGRRRKALLQQKKKMARRKKNGTAVSKKTTPETQEKIEKLPKLEDAVNGLSGLADFTAEHGGKRWRMLKKLVLTWKNGLVFTLHFGPARGTVDPNNQSQEVQQGELSLSGVRLVWVSVESQHTFSDRSRVAEGGPRPANFPSKLAAQAQQNHFIWSQEESEIAATHKLLKWLAEKIEAGPTSFPK